MSTLNEWLTSQEWFKYISEYLSYGVLPESEQWIVNNGIPILGLVTLIFIVWVIFFTNGKENKKNE